MLLVLYAWRNLFTSRFSPRRFCTLAADMENPLLELARAYVETTNTIVFLTGKAGTGKTTLLREIRQTSKKRLAIVAPTGVAAINAGGMTIHSLFQLPFGPMLPNQPDRPEQSYNAEKRELLQSLELLIIDEISMVRPDVLDQIDLILRNLRGNRYCFGGVQLLLIGDLAQLSPIVRGEEWALLRPYYATPYFFSARVLAQNAFVRIELDKVYRQSDPVFVDILNAMRDQQVSADKLARLNERYIPAFEPATDEPYITLTTHNRMAQQLNSERLGALPGNVMDYKATIRGEFPADAYPTETNLELKTGAQVMFVKNDSSAEKRYYNGKIGTVIKLEPDTVYVATPDGREIAVQALEWTNVKYQADGEQISESNAGSFAQIPLKLAWAITIHKSQGLTFDKAIIDVSEAFTHGQAYVALSRCRSLEGLVLRNPVNDRNIIADPAVLRFNREAEQHRPDQNTLAQHREDYRLFLLTELFNFSELRYRLKKFEALLPDFEQAVFAVAEKLPAKLPQYADERIRNAAGYFDDKFKTAITKLHEQLTAFVGTSKEMAGKADELLRWLLTRSEQLEVFCQLPFTAEAYLNLQRKGKASLSFSLLKQLNAKSNEALAEQLINWRNEAAQQEGVLANMLFSEQTLFAIAAKLPQNLKALGAIKGVGAEKSARYGAAILTLIRAYQQEGTGAADQVSLF
ncbi:AAA family ATPase [Mucilaginibacter mali]|uniref:AAA family ATPase n=1 Tax=Mucilaginibacter mali TaxID=2740462 RepID=A0A7D4Q9P7_9SPHI|nr:HRDC domain-containing protein [Mucilaginibacter mali]QKJ29544.1 AAA family ATPase [Mucilaginibacter mali]